MNEQFNNNEVSHRHSREGGNLRECPPTLNFCGECSKEKLGFQNGNSKIFEKNKRYLDEIPAFAGMTV
jgi:hypothetical protein